MTSAYGLAPDTPEPEIVAHLFKLYADKMKGLDNPARKLTHRTLRRRRRYGKPPSWRPARCEDKLTER